MAETNPLPGRSCGRRQPRAGFTLVEVLVVIGIIVLLISILLPAIGKAYTQSVRTKMQTDIQAIVQALEAYRQDHGDFPRTSPDGTTVNFVGRLGSAGKADGAQLLCRALMGPGQLTVDGADGPGFRTIGAIGGVAQGKVYGPYLPMERFKLVKPDTGFTPVKPDVVGDADNACIADRGGRPILYYPAIKNAEVRAPNGFISRYEWGVSTGIRPMFNSMDNDLFLPIDKFEIIMGDAAVTAGTNNLDPAKAKNGQIDDGEQAEYTGDFVLLSAGPDNVFGPADATKSISSKNPCDDVTNFGR